MDKTTAGAAIVTTAAGTTGSAALFPIVMWLIAGCPQPVPEATAVAIAAYAAIGIHLAGVAISRVMTRFFPDLAAGSKPAPALANGTPAAPTSAA